MCLLECRATLCTVRDPFCTPTAHSDVEERILPAQTDQKRRIVPRRIEIEGSIAGYGVPRATTQGERGEGAIAAVAEWTHGAVLAESSTGSERGAVRGRAGGILLELGRSGGGRTLLWYSIQQPSAG